jgi:hypothetical protein
MLDPQTLDRPLTDPALAPAVRHSARELYRHFARCGFTAREAGDLTARLEGLGAVRSGWTLAQVERMLFLRWLHEHDRLA